ncbi:MAG: hypothetical protein KJZ69_17865 [Phycisphaerales bacterium]|nr:hypothetical protein [Phycisphaerales bacterium]
MSRPNRRRFVRSTRSLRTAAVADARPAFDALEPRRLLTVIVPHLVFDPAGAAPVHVGSLSGQGQSAEFLFTPGASGSAMFDHGGAPELDSAITVELFRGTERLAVEDDGDQSSAMQANVVSGVEYRLVLRSNVGQSVEYAAAIDLPAPPITALSLDASGDFNSGLLRFDTATQAWYFSYVAPSSGLLEVEAESDDVRRNGEDFDTDLFVFDASGAEIHRDVNPRDEGRWNTTVVGGATYSFLIRQDISGFDVGTFTFKLEGPSGGGGGGGGGGGNNGAPPSLSATPGVVRFGDTLTLLIENDGHGGGRRGRGGSGTGENEFEVRRAWFYRDSNRNGVHDADDALLGSDFNDDFGFRWVGGVSHTWGAGDQGFFAVIEDDTQSTRTLSASVTIDNAAAASQVRIYEEDGDEITLSLAGSNGTIRYEVDDRGRIDRIIIDGEDFSSGKLSSILRRGQGSDGRLSVGTLVGEDGLPIENLRLRSIDLRNVDFTGEGLRIAGADTLMLGDLTGSASISGVVGRLTLGRVDTDGSIDLGSVTSITADSLNVRGGLRVQSVQTINVRGDGHFSIDAGDDNSASTINRIRVRGNASGTWTFRGETEVRNVLIDGRGELELNDDRTGRSSVRRMTVRGDDDFSSMHIEMEHLERLDVHGGLRLIDDSDIRGLRSMRVRGSFDSGSLGLWGDDSARYRIDGDVVAGTVLNVNGGTLDVRGDVQGTVNLDGARKADVRGSLAGGTINVTNGETTRLRVHREAASGSTISAETSMKEIMLGSLLDSAIYMGLRNWPGGIPGSLSEFDAPDSILERLTVKGTTSGATVVAPQIDHLDLGRLSDAAVTHLAAGSVDEARFTAADGVRHFLRDRGLFDNAPALPYLDLVELL